MFRENWEKANKRNSATITGSLGANGAGKSALLVHDAMAAMLEGRPQLSTVALLDWTAVCFTCGAAPCVADCTHDDDRDGYRRPAHPLWVPFESLEQLLTWRDGDVNIDEIQGVAPSADHQGLPYQVANFLRKLRHYDVRLRWTAPDWMAAHPVVRRVTRAVSMAEGSIGKPHVKVCPGCFERHVKPTKKCDLTGRSRLWEDNRLLKWRTFDATKFEEFNANRVNGTANKKNRLKPMTRQAYWRPGGLVERGYSTYAEVLSMGVIDTSGVCITCGGSRPRKKCQGHGEGDDLAAPVGVQLRDFVAAGGVNGAGGRHRY